MTLLALEISKQHPSSIHDMSTVYSQGLQAIKMKHGIVSRPSGQKELPSFCVFSSEGLNKWAVIHASWFMLVHAVIVGAGFPGKINTEPFVCISIFEGKQMKKNNFSLIQSNQFSLMPKSQWGS